MTDSKAELRAYSDDCGTIQSSINKNLEILDKLLGFKDFLDDLIPQREREIIEKRKHERAEIKEKQRLARKAEREAEQSRARAVRGNSKDKAQNQPDDDMKTGSVIDDLNI